MDLDSYIIAVFCRIDDALKTLLQGKRLRQRGIAPVLSDSEVLTMEAVGEFLGLSQDTELYSYFREHYRGFFPDLPRVHRTTFVRQAANLWKVTEQLWQHLLGSIRYDPAFALVDSFPPPPSVSSLGLTDVGGSREKLPSVRISCPGRPSMDFGFTCV